MKSNSFGEYLRLFGTARGCEAHVQALAMLFTLPIFIVYALIHLIVIAGYLVVGTITSALGLVFCIMCPFAYLFDWIWLKLRKNV